MKNWKIVALLTTCACLVNTSSFAVEQPQKNSNIRTKAAAAAKSNPREESVSNLTFSKKTYMDQIERSFEAMDANKDGRLDMKEMSKGSTVVEEDYDDDSAAYEDMPQLQASAPVQAQAPVRSAEAPKAEPQSEPYDGGAGVPPVNASQLIK